MADPRDTRLGVIGLGEMGSTLARALLKAGYPTCVWNRTADKSRALADAGAVLAASPADAADRSDVLVVCKRRSRPGPAAWTP